jgi:HAD superfamily hydrolase (TIGR01450 family)
VTSGSDDFVVCCDLDGVIWRGDQPIAGAAEGVAELRAAGLRVVFLTNNSSGRVYDYVARLESAGITATPEDVGSSAQAAAAMLGASLSAGARVLPCAGAGVVEALEASGFVIVDRAPADAVVVGWHSTFNFERLRLAADAIRAGARYVATNLDPTYPGAEGLLPGAGSIAAAVSTASGRVPEVAGKPHAPMVTLVRARFGTRGVMVGDRPSTDGALATALDWPFALVLSGVAGAQGEEPVPDPAPPFVAANLGDLAPQLVKTFARA